MSQVFNNKVFTELRFSKEHRKNTLIYSTYLQNSKHHNKLCSRCGDLAPGIYQTLSDFGFSHRHLCFHKLQKDVEIFINLVGSECSKMDSPIICYVLLFLGAHCDSVRYVVRNWHLPPLSLVMLHFWSCLLLVHLQLKQMRVHYKIFLGKHYRIHNCRLNIVLGCPCLLIY